MVRLLIITKCLLTQFRLCNVRFTTVRAKLDLAEVTISTRTGEFNATSLEHVINTEAIRKLVVQTWLEKACQSFASFLF